MPSNPGRRRRLVSHDDTDGSRLCARSLAVSCAHAHSLTHPFSRTHSRHQPPCTQTFRILGTVKVYSVKRVQPGDIVVEEQPSGRGDRESPKDRHRNESNHGVGGGEREREREFADVVPICA